MQVTKTYRTETGHRLMAYAGKCGHVHGHSYLWEWTVGGDIDIDSGMVVDFGIMKKIMKQVIGPFDHALVLEHTDPLAQLAHRMFAPQGAPTDVFVPVRLIVLPFNPTVENLAEHVWSLLGEAVFVEDDPDNPQLAHIEAIQLKVWETQTSYAVIRKED